MNVRHMFFRFPGIICLLANIMPSSIGAQQQQNIQRDESPPIYAAIRKGNLHTVRLMLDKGENINQKDSIYGTPLHCALQHLKVAAAKLLVERGADVNQMHPLREAVIANDTALVRLMIAKGAKVNYQDSFGTTELHYIATYVPRYSRFAQLLLDLHANPNLQDKAGETPLMYAAARGRVAVLKVLLEHHADLTIKNKNGQTALQLARKYKQKEVETLLLKAGAKE
jgi:ankyrin repeat protein